MGNDITMFASQRVGLRHHGFLPPIPLLPRPRPLKPNILFSFFSCSRFAFSFAIRFCAVCYARKRKKAKTRGRNGINELTLTTTRKNAREIGETKQLAAHGRGLSIFDMYTCMYTINLPFFSSGLEGWPTQTPRFYASIRANNDRKRDVHESRLVAVRYSVHFCDGLWNLHRSSLRKSRQQLQIPNNTKM